MGFTKMETMVTSQVFFDSLMSERCPLWRHPIVGMNPIVLPVALMFLEIERISFADETVLISASGHYFDEVIYGLP